MRIETTTRELFTFEELLEDIKDKAVENLYDLNVNYEWFEGVYMDADDIGLKINSFDVDRASYCKMEYVDDFQTVIASIIRNHGAHCDTTKTAKEYEAQIKFDEEGDIENLEELEKDFLKAISEDYLDMLRKEYEYLTREEAIIETIKANEYEFTAEGKLA